MDRHQKISKKRKIPSKGYLKISVTLQKFSVQQNSHTNSVQDSDQNFILVIKRRNRGMVFCVWRYGIQWTQTTMVLVDGYVWMIKINQYSLLLYFYEEFYKYLILFFSRKDSSNKLYCLLPGVLEWKYIQGQFVNSSINVQLF